MTIEKELPIKKETTNTNPLVPMDKILESGAYFGHKTSMWNPKMKPYIRESKKGIHIIDPKIISQSLTFAYKVINKYASQNASFIFVGTRKQSSKTIKENALRSNAFYINNRWLGGILTNHTTIRKRVMRMQELERMKENEFDGYTKKEIIGLEKQLAKLQKNLKGIQDMKRLPDFMIVADPQHDLIAVQEARKINIKIIGMIDTNTDPTLVDIVIPSNDDSTKANDLIITLLADAIVQAKEGEVKYAFKTSEEIVLPVTPKRPPRKYPPRFGNSNYGERSSYNSDYRKNLRNQEATAGKAQIDSMDDLEKLTVSELKKKAELKDIKNYRSMNKHELINALKVGEK